MSRVTRNPNIEKIQRACAKFGLRHNMANNGLKERFVWKPRGAENCITSLRFLVQIDDPFNGASEQAPPLAADLHLDTFGNFTC